MSGLPIISASHSNPVMLREPIAALPPQVSGNIAANVRTITAEAVQQARAIDTTSAPLPKALVSQTLARSRLVGPPPAFEVNLLQHMRETRTETESPKDPHIEQVLTAATGQADSPAAQTEPEAPARTDQGSRSGYETLEALAALEQGGHRSEMDWTL